MKKLSMLFFFSSVAFAQSQPALPVPDETNHRLFPEETTVRGEYEYKKRFATEAEKNAALQDQVNKAREKLIEEMKAGPVGLKPNQPTARRAVGDHLKPRKSDHFREV